MAIILSLRLSFVFPLRDPLPLSRTKKIPASFDVGMPFFILNRLRSRDPSPRGPIEQDIPWAGLLASGSTSGRVFPFSQTVTFSGLCPRLQRRDRDGIAPSSLSPVRATHRDTVRFIIQPSDAVKRNEGASDFNAWRQSYPFDGKARYLFRRQNLKTPDSNGIGSVGRDRDGTQVS